MGVGVVQGATIECGRCRKNVPPGAKFCRRCGYALQGGPLTRALRAIGGNRGRARTRSARPTRPSLFAIEPVLLLFAALGGVAVSVVRNVGRLASPEAVGHAIGSGLVMLLMGAVVGRVGWALARRSQPVGILSGMATIFLLSMSLIARWSGSDAVPRRSSAGAVAAQVAPAAVAPAAVVPADLQPVEVPRTAGQPLPPTLLSQLPLRWRSSGRQLDCTIRNGTGWQLTEVEIQLTVWSRGRVVRTEWCKVPASIAPGATATLDLPLVVDQDPQRTFDCRITAARGVANSRL